MKKSHRPSFALLALFLATPWATAEPIRALLVCGGCCHDYASQSKILQAGIQARANVRVDVVRSEVKGTAPDFPIYQNKDWAKGYDVVIHDECAADVKDKELVARILDAHRAGLPAVNLHCAAHSYRTGTDMWFSFMGVQSSAHGWKKPITVDFSASQHPITEGMMGWTTINEELYNNVKVFETAKPLALGNQENSKGGTDTTVVAWTNDYHGTKIFNTTLGHENKTVEDDRYLNLVVRGLLWSCGKLDAEHLVPYSGPEGTHTVIPAPAAPTP